MEGNVFLKGEAVKFPRPYLMLDEFFAVKVLEDVEPRLKEMYRHDEPWEEFFDDFKVVFAGSVPTEKWGSVECAVVQNDRTGSVYVTSADALRRKKGA